MTGPVAGAKKDMGHQKQLTVAGKLWSVNNNRGYA